MNDFGKCFIGAWTLQDYQITNLETGAQSYPFGENASGHIIYTAEGVMSATLLNPNRTLHTTDRVTRLNFKTKLDAQGLSNLTDEENLVVLTYLEAAYGYVGYTGTFEADDNKVYHHVQNSFYPNFIGMSINRDYHFEDNLLHLTAEGGGLRDQLIWRRVENNSGLPGA